MSFIRNNTVGKIQIINFNNNIIIQHILYKNNNIILYRQNIGHTSDIYELNV